MILSRPSVYGLLLLTALFSCKEKKQPTGKKSSDPQKIVTEKIEAGRFMPPSTDTVLIGFRYGMTYRTYNAHMDSLKKKGIVDQTDSPPYEYTLHILYEGEVYDAQCEIFPTDNTSEEYRGEFYAFRLTCAYPESPIGKRPGANTLLTAFAKDRYGDPVTVHSEYGTEHHYWFTGSQMIVAQGSDRVGYLTFIDHSRAHKQALYDEKIAKERAAQGVPGY